MKRLLLLRHAKAVPPKDAKTDIGRPLAERGVRDAGLIGERLRQLPLPNLIVSSSATRALQTAELVAAAIGYPPPQIVLEQRLYLAEPAALLTVVAAQSAAHSTLLVVGHNPGLTDLTHRLLPSFDIADLPTCAVVGLEFGSAKDWADAARVTPVLFYYDFPKNSASPVRAR